ncbi:MAG: hypothetical protein IJU40_05420 [Desulfovibrionaceae bacterium]|nr:hypothetical protein [Desulfovibrionaceae bacterium]
MENISDVQAAAKMQSANNLQADEKEEQASYLYTHKFLFLFLAGLVLAVGIVAVLLCNAKVQVLEQNIKVSQRNAEQAWVDVTLDNVRMWRTKLLESIHQISQAEMFRLFANDVYQACGDNLSVLKSAEVLHDENHELHSMSEEFSYLRDLLQDTVKRRKWYTAKILNPNGKDIIALSHAKSLDVEQQVAIEMVKKERRTAFTTIYQQDKHLLMDIIDPLYEALSSSGPKIVGYFVVTVKMDNELKEIFSERYLQDNTFKPSLLTQGSKGYSVLKIEGGKVQILNEILKLNYPKIPFAERKALIGDQPVYSQGGKLNNPNWWVVLEKDSHLIEAVIERQAWEIYSIGVLGSLAIALVLAIVVGTSIARSRAREGQKCINGLVHAIECALDGTEAKIQYLQGRSHKLLRFSRRIAQIMKLSGENIENIQLAARLSQVGKIFVPRDIMVKRGTLTEEERRQVQLAPYHAYNVLRGILPGKVARIVYQMGGKVVDDPVTGNNHELTTKEMLLEARVLLVANDFCAMVSQRGTRPPLPMDIARQKLEDRPLYDRQVIAAVNTLSDDEIRELLDLPKPKEEAA